MGERRARVGWFSKKGGAWDLAAVERPWPPGRSIYEHVYAHLPDQGPGLRDGGETLPDEKDDGALTWVAGGLDGAYLHHVAGKALRDRARMLHRALRVVVEDASAGKLKKLYDQLLGGSAIDAVDPLLELIEQKEDVDRERLASLALWLARHAPDREPVKIAIALLGLAGTSEHEQVLQVLGRHEEMTLYAAGALARICETPAGAEAALFALAKQVRGWGRIHVVERLADTEDAAIQAWMIRDGFRNDVMNEYLACKCARGGDLRGALERDTVDAELLAAAGEIIQALITGGPAEDMGDYADGDVVVTRYLHHLGDEPRALAQLITVDAVLGYLRDHADWAPDRREAIRARGEAIRGMAHWRDAIASGLASTAPESFAEAEQAARALGIDTWDAHFRRLASGEEASWYHVMQTDDPARVERVIGLAEERIALEEIATGPAEERGLGPAWHSHRLLGWVVQELGRFPGRGWPLVRAALQSPVIRNRHMGLRALSTWGTERWPSDARAALEELRALEPVAEVHRRIDAVLAGRAIDDDDDDDR